MRRGLLRAGVYQIGAPLFRNKFMVKSASECCKRAGARNDAVFRFGVAMPCHGTGRERGGGAGACPSARCVARGALFADALSRLRVLPPQARNAPSTARTRARCSRAATSPTTPPRGSAGSTQPSVSCAPRTTTIAQVHVAAVAQVSRVRGTATTEQTASGGWGVRGVGRGSEGAKGRGGGI